VVPEPVEFAGYHAAWHGHTLRSLSAKVPAVSRLACVGAWQALGAHLAGDPDVRVTGSVQLGGADQRALVANGQIGIARLEQTVPETDTVDAWLAEHTILGGQPAKQAARAAKQLLVELNLGFLANRRFNALGSAEQYAALVACALATAPRLVWLPEPRVPEALMPFCRDLLARVAERAQLIVVFTAEPDFDLLLACDHVLAIQNGTLLANCSVATWLDQGVHYRVTPLNPAPRPASSGNSEFEAHLRAEGVAIHNPGRSELYVSLPAPGATDSVLRACAASALGLSELRPLFFSPSAR
jgi:ABC-type Na+ transport system ATPase subunit NatA